MFSPTYLSICIYCMLQLGYLVWTGTYRQNVRVGDKRYFLWMHIIVLLSFTANIISSLQTNMDWLFPFVSAGNYIEFILNATLIPMFFCYICDQVINLDATLKQRMKIALWSLTILCALIIASTIFTGKIFYFDEARVYHRGPLFAIPMMIMLVMMIMVEVFLISHKKKIEPVYYKSLLFFLIAPLIGWCLQFLIYGLPFSLLGITFSSLILHTNIKNRNIDKDYLTDAFNRQALDDYMSKKIKNSEKNKSFSALLLDIDNFKSINDNFGHFEGDTALINAVKILRSSLEPTNFIARYGGDEFCVIINSGDLEKIKSVISKINENLMVFNTKNDKQYKLNFSIGYAIYNHSIGNTPESFLKVIDKKMYEQKLPKKNKSTSVE